MRIKAKLTVGVGALFLLILALAIVSGWYVNQLKKDTNNILVANYNTLQYARNMLLSLEDVRSDKSAVNTFQKNLDLQKQNVTEIGEIEATNLIVKHFKDLKEMFYKHLQLVTTQAVAELNKNWKESISAYDEGEIHMLKFSDMITDAMIKQFPDKFR